MTTKNDKFFVRGYGPRDLVQLQRVYRSAFAEPPWNEYKKCLRCEAEYGKKECEVLPGPCKKCKAPLLLIDFWSSESISNDLNFALSQKDPIVLVAKSSDRLLGFTWGYRLPLDKFPFLNGKVGTNASYMDEVAVDGEMRRAGIGTGMCQAYLGFARSLGIDSIILRTDERNQASVGLFTKLNFLPMKMSTKSASGDLDVIRDPQFPNRVYFEVKIVNRGK